MTTRLTSPILALDDQRTCRQLQTRLPQSLLIVNEPGLDGPGVATELALTVSTDLIRLEPEPGKSTIGVGITRNTLAKLRTYATTRRIVLVEHAELLEEPAQNTLLKAIEEPNANTHFILIATDKKALLSTIRSRCQIFTLHRTSHAQDSQLLKTFDLDAATASQIRFLAAGRPALIHTLACNPKILCGYQNLAANAKQLIAAPHTYDSLCRLQAYTNRSDALSFLDVVLTILRFQLKQPSPTPALHKLLERVIASEQHLKANGNVKLALLQLVV